MEAKLKQELFDQEAGDTQELETVSPVGLKLVEIIPLAEAVVPDEETIVDLSEEKLKNLTQEEKTELEDTLGRAITKHLEEIFIAKNAIESKLMDMSLEDKVAYIQKFEIKI